jgi:hypothetical protein
MKHRRGSGRLVVPLFAIEMVDAGAALSVGRNVGVIRYFLFDEIPSFGEICRGNG